MKFEAYCMDCEQVVEPNLEEVEIKLWYMDDLIVFRYYCPKCGKSHTFSLPIANVSHIMNII